MDKEYWLEKWQSGDIAFHRQDITPDLIRYIHKLNLQPNHCVLVPLCGKSKDMVWLANKGYYVVGIELSPLACQEFFAELGADPKITKKGSFTKYEHHNIELLCGDIFELTPKDLPTAHVIYDCKALVALPPEVQKKYVDQLIACAGPQVKVLLLAIESQGEVQGPPFPIDSSEIKLLYGPKFVVQQLKSEPANEIPAHLKHKQFEEFIETVYLISGKH